MRSASPKALFFLLGVLVVLVAFATLPASAQEAPAAAPAVSLASQTSVSPALYNPAATAFATKPAKPAPANGSDDVDWSRKWEVEFHGGGSFASTSHSGVGALPNPGLFFSTFTGRQTQLVPSWYFASGSALYNNTAGAAGLANTITPWDPVIQSNIVRRSHGGQIGGRISRDFNPRVNFELSFDYNLSTLGITGGALLNTQATSDSFVAAFSEFLGPTFVNATGVSVTSTPTIVTDRGHQFLFTGAANINVVTQGRWIPYVTLGAGFIHADSTDTPAVTLTGNYTFTSFGQTFNETTAVTVKSYVDGLQFTGVLGGGFKYYVTPHWGIRVDARDYLYANSLNQSLAVTNTIVTTGAGCLATNFAGGAPAHNMQFCNIPPPTAFSSSLAPGARPPIRSFNASGIDQNFTLTGGIFWRF